MGSSYLNTTCAPVAVLNAASSYTIQGMLGLLGTVKGGSMPSPQRPGRTYLKCLLLCALSTLCFPGSSRSEENEITSKQLLTTFSMTCMELEQRVSKSYSDQGCLPLPTDAWPLQEVRWYQCPIRRHYGWAYVNRSSLSVPGYCAVWSGACTFNGFLLNVFTLTNRYGSESCKE